MLATDRSAPFGQHEELTTRLASLVRQYPAGPGIIKEFIQNADDAGASRLDVVMDWRDRRDSVPADDPIRPLLGPGLLIANDAIFTDKDFDDIKEIGDSGKRLDWGKTGRFGVGFNTAYNLTDHPSFLSRRWLVCLDPHGSAVAEPGHGGRQFPLPILRKEHPALERTFCASPNFTSGVDNYDGTIFRLPLRSAAQAKLSRISSEVFDRKDFDRIISLLTLSGAEMLLFTRNVLHLTVAQIEHNKSHPFELLSVSTTNASEVQASRGRVYGAMPKDLNELWKNWSNSGGVQTTHRHNMVIRTAEEQKSAWQVCVGFFPDQEGKLKRQSEVLATYKEKAIPEAGAAVLILTVSAPSVAPTEGRYYCGLPLPNPSGLPVHVHGCFDLDQSRSGLTSNTGAIGLGGERYLWNELLIERAVPRAWAGAIASLPREIVERDIDSYYALWPKIDTASGSLTQRLTVCLHRMLSNYKLYRSTTKTGADFRDLKNLMALIYSGEETDLFDALVADGITIADPPLPLQIQSGAKAAGLVINHVTSKFLCDRYRSPKFTDIALSQAPFPALQKRDWLVAITKFILSPGQPLLRGLPLALLSNGNLAAFGNANAKRTFIASPGQREIFKQNRHWFIEDEYFIETGLKSQDKADFSIMTSADVLANLSKVLPKIEDSPWQEWNPSGDVPPNEQWLTTLIRYLRENSGSIALDQLEHFPLVPDQFRRLYSLRNVATPLLRPKGVGSRRLVGALERLEIPLVTAGEMLTAELQTLGDEFQGGIWWANRVDIIDALEHYSAEWSAKCSRFDDRTFSPILDLLNSFSEDEFSEELRKKLRAVPIVPLNDGRLAKASEDDLFVPEIEVPEFVSGSTKIVRVGPNARWSPLWNALGLQKLNLPTLIVKVIIPQYPSLAAAEKLRALEFVKIQLKAAYDEAENSGEADMMRLALRGAPLIAASDGEYRAPNELFDPDEKEIFDVLGEETPVPDLKRYQPGEKVWLEFFRELGIKRHIDAADIIGTIENYSSNLPNRSSRRLAERLLRHISEKWEHFRNAKCSFGGDERLLTDALSDMAWLPARITARARLPGFKQPEDRFYVPAELYRGSLDHRVCSQAPLLGTIDPPAAVAKALGMPQRPLVEHVTAHFDHLRDLWSNQEGIVASDLERSLGEIYRFFGELSRESGPAARDDLGARYEGVECIWDRRRKRFYQPADCFSESVNFFDPFKVQIAGDQLGAAGLDLLGRRKSPEWRDYLDFVRQLAAHKGNESCSPEETKQVLYSLDQLATLMPSEEEDADSLFILLTSGKLGIATEVWADDVPHWKGRLELSSLAIVDDRVPTRLRYLVKQLSGHVAEELGEEPQQSFDKQLEGLCNQVTRTIRSGEFVAGLRRLVSYEYHGIPSGYEPKTAQLELIPAVSIRTCFWLDDGGNERQIGGGETKFFLDREAGRIWIATASLRSARPHLARAINRFSEPFSLRDLSSLEAILFVAPEEIAEILDEREVPRVGANPEEDWHFDIPADPEGEETPSASEDEDMELPTGSAKDGDASRGESEHVAGNDAVVGGGGDLVLSSKGGVAPGDISRTGAGGAARGRRSGTTHSDGHASSQSAGGATARVGTDDAPPTTPGQGYSGRPPVGTGTGRQRSVPRSPRQGGTKGDSRQKGRYSTYVNAADAANVGDRDSDAEPDDREAQDIGAAAVKIVLDFERRQGRQPREMPRNNPGYDVISESPTGEQRYIEVKGVDGTWGELGVAVSHTQFKFAQLHSGRAWLYVVEHARGPLNPIVHPIQAPATKVTQFVFDAGWKTVAKEAADHTNAVPPALGDEIMIEHGEVAVVAAIEPIGDLIRMEVKKGDGSAQKVIWQPGSHTIIRRYERGKDDPGVA